MEYQRWNWYHFNGLSGDQTAQQLIHSIDKSSWALGDKPPRQNMYDVEHAELFASIRAGKPLHNGSYMCLGSAPAIAVRIGRVLTQSSPVGRACVRIVRSGLTDANQIGVFSILPAAPSEDDLRDGRPGGEEFLPGGLTGPKPDSTIMPAIGEAACREAATHL